MNNERQASKKFARENSLKGIIGSCCGDPIMPVYKRVYDKDLDKSVVKETDKFNLDEFIQASLSQTDLAILYKRYQEFGEIPAVDPSMTSADFSNYPEDIHEVYKLASDIAGNFAKLPQSIQDIFGTKEAYMKSLIDGTYQATLINAVNSMKKNPVNQVESDGNNNE